MKNLLYAPCCGGKMTAGWTRGCTKRYLYYRCIKHSNVNLSGAKMHKKLELVLAHLSFTQEQIDRIEKQVRVGLDNTSEIRKKELEVAKAELEKAEKKMFNVEENLFDGEISKYTYQRWQRKLNNQMAHL